MGADQVTRFARVDFRSDERVFGIKDEDRFLHIYIIGKTGTGKSTLLENMALQDLEFCKVARSCSKMGAQEREHLGPRGAPRRLAFQHIEERSAAKETKTTYHK